jgi:orotate phosphoribosyltransferase
MNKDTIGKEIINLLYDAGGIIKIWPKDNVKGWRLHGDKWSPFYINLRLISSKKNGKLILDRIGKGMSFLIKNEIDEANKLVGVATAGIPISVITTYISGLPSCYTRKIENVKTLDDLKIKLKEYGDHDVIEGDLIDGDNIVIVDDLITDGGSKLIAKELIEYAKKEKKISITCKNVAVVIDREQGGAEELKEAGLDVHSLIPFKTKGIYWLKDKLKKDEFELIKDYLKDDSKYQDEALREKLFKELSI